MPKCSSLIGTLVCVLIALVLRLAIVANRWDQLDQDRDAYLGIASNLFDGRGYCSPNSNDATAFRPPLYPILLAIGLSAFPMSIVVAGINIITGLLTVWLTIRLGMILQVGTLRFVAGLLVAIDPLLLSYTSQPMTECLCTFLAAFWLWTVMAVWPTQADCRSINGGMSGIALGLLVLCRPTFWPVAGLCGLRWLWTLWRTRSSSIDPRTEVNHMAWFWSVCGLFIVVAPWLIRNWMTFGVPVLTTTHGGYTLLLGNNPTFYHEVVQQPWGTVWQRESLLNWQSSLEQQIEKDLGPIATEVARDAWHSQQARDAIFANPQLFCAAVIHRIRSLWNTIPQGESTDGVGNSVMVAVSWFYTMTLIAGGIGLVMSLRDSRREQWFPLYALIICVQLAHLVYWTNTRMRAPLTPVIALLVASTISGFEYARVSDRKKA